MNKKGQGAAVLGFLLLGVMGAFLLYLLAVPLASVWDDISTEFKEPENFGSDNKTVESIEKFDGFLTPVMDQIVFFGFIGVLLILLVLAIFTDAHPVFMIFLFIGLIVVVIIGSQLVGVADEVTANDELNGKADDFTFSSLIFGTYFPVIILIFGVTVIIILFASRSGGGGA